MEVVSARSVSSLNPYAAPYVPAAFRAVEDFSDEWWELVRSTPWFRNYWLRECFQEENETENDPDFVDILDPATDDFLFHSNPPQQDDEEEKWVKSKLELVKLGAEKWRGPRMGAVGPRRCDKAPKIVSVKVSPRMIQQPR